MDSTSALVICRQAMRQSAWRVYSRNEVRRSKPRLRLTTEAGSSARVFLPVSVSTVSQVQRRTSRSSSASTTTRTSGNHFLFNCFLLPAKIGLSAQSRGGDSLLSLRPYVRTDRRFSHFGVQTQLFGNLRPLAHAGAGRFCQKRV